MVSIFTKKKKMKVTEERDFYTPHKQLRIKQKYYIFQKSKFYIEISIFLLLFIKLELMLTQKA